MFLINFSDFTTSSNLKNNYNNIAIQLSDAIIETKYRKIGCMVGDYVKTAVGTNINTGTLIGIGCNIISLNGFPWHHRFLAD